MADCANCATCYTKNSHSQRLPTLLALTCFPAAFTRGWEMTLVMLAVVPVLAGMGE